MQINLQANVKDAIKKLDKIQRQQLPFASSVALNETAAFTATNLNNDTRQYFDKPTPFTQKSFSMKRSSKRNLRAAVFAKDVQAEYLHYQIRGGTRLPKRRAIPVPVNLKRNRYGNMPRGRIKKLLARPNVFSGIVYGIGGIWQRGSFSRSGNFTSSSRRRGTALRLLVAWEPKASYTPLFPYDKLANRYVQRAITPFFDKALRKALATAR